MKKYFEVLRKCPLFNDVSDENLLPMLSCLGATVKTYDKKETVISEGESAKHVGIVLSGTVQIVQIDYFGNRTIVAHMGASELFGESFSCADVESVPVDVIAVEDAEIMFVDSKRIIKSCSNACSFHQQIIYNLMKIIATKNLLFHQKISITSKRSTKEKLMAYLLIQAKKNNSNSFKIPYDRQELADYLGVERSGLSAEISKLCKEGILISRKNEFTLLTE